MKSLLLCLCLLVGVGLSGALAADVTITTGAAIHGSGQPAYGMPMTGMTSTSRLYRLLHQKFTNDSLYLWTSTNNGATWVNVTVNAAKSIHYNSQYENVPTLQIFGDTAYVLSGTASAGQRRIAKIFADSVYSRSGTTYFDSITTITGWEDARNVVNFRNDSLITFKDSALGFTPIIGNGGRLANNGTTTWTQGTRESISEATRYAAYAVNSVVAAFGAQSHDVWVSTGYDIDTANTDFPSLTREEETSTMLYHSIVSVGPTDSLIIAAFEIADSAVAYRGKVTFNGTNWVFTVIDSTVLVPLGFVPRTESEQNSIWPTITIRNDSAYIAYQKCADTTVPGTKTIYYKVFPIRGAANTFVGGAEQTFRASTGADTLWYFSLPPRSYGNYLTATFQSTNNLGTATTWKSNTIELAAPPSGSKTYRRRRILNLLGEIDHETDTSLRGLLACAVR